MLDLNYIKAPLQIIFFQNIFHGAMSLDQLFLTRPVPWGSYSPLTPVQGLLLCGAGGHPGGGVTGSPGRLAAMEAANLLRLNTSFTL